MVEINIDNHRLKKYLLDTSVIDGEALNTLYIKAENDHILLSDLLLDQNIVRLEELLQILSYIHAVPYVDLEGASIIPEVEDLLSLDFIKKYHIFPYQKIFNRLEMAMLCPSDIDLLQLLRQKTGLIILPRLTTREDLEIAYARHTDSQKNEIVSSNSDFLKQKQQDAVKDAAISGIIESILRNAILEDAEEIHIDPQNRDIIILYRINGQLHYVYNLPIRLLIELAAVLKNMAGLDYFNISEAYSGGFEFENTGFTLKSYPVFDGERFVIYKQDVGSSRRLDDLGIRQYDLAAIRSAINLNQGLVIVTGPQKSGKSSMLYSMLKEFSSDSNNISTIEEHIQYRIPQINHTEIDLVNGIDIEFGLKSIVDQDADIIMVDEIRSASLVNLAAQTAMAGKLVLASYQANNIFEALSDLVEMDVKKFYLSGSLEAIVAQNTVRKLCPECKVKRKLSEEELAKLGDLVDIQKLGELINLENKKPDRSVNLKDIDFYTNRGCRYCHKTGYKGSLGLYEVLRITPEIEEMIDEKNWLGNKNVFYKNAKQSGMISMLEDGILKAAAGETSIKELLFNFQNKV